jgi:hypothetical protein
MDQQWCGFANVDAAFVLKILWLTEGLGPESPS